MANQKVSARPALVTGVDPVNDILPIVDLSAGVSGSKKITINNLFIGWGMTPAGESLAKALTLKDQKNLLGVNMDFDITVKSYTGGGPDNLDGVPTIGTTGKRLRLAFLSNKFHVYLGDSSNVPENSPFIIQADDQSSAYFWEMLSFKMKNLDAVVVTLQSTDKLSNLVLDPGTAAVAPSIRAWGVNVGIKLQFEYGAANAVITVPKGNGRLKLDPITTVIVNPLTNANVVVASLEDQVFINNTAAVPSLIFYLPSLANCRNTQVIMGYSDSAVTAITFTVGSGTTIASNAPTTLAANGWFKIMYISALTKWIVVP